MKEYVDARKRPPKMPEISDGEHIIGYLQELGWVSSGGMSVSPLSFFEIESWSRMTGVELTSWESSMIRELSVAYCNQMDASKDTRCPSPWISHQDEPEEIADALDKAFDRFDSNASRKR